MAIPTRSGDFGPGQERSGPALIVQAGPCPVPQDQRPLREYQQLLESWFFVWPSGPDGWPLLRALALSFLLLLPLALLVATGSVPLRHDIPRLVVAAATASVSLPLLLLLRQWMGWTYVQKRLLADQVYYEESGWYDGQVWEKPLAWRQQDLLVATHQVRPLLARLRQGIGLAAGLILLGAGLCQAL
ncbi:MAG: CGLD27 family protein [Cyanobacteriota bacterium]